MVDFAALTTRFSSREVRAEEPATEVEGHELATDDALELAAWDSKDESLGAQAEPVLEGDDQQVLESMGDEALGVEMGGADEAGGASVPYTHPDMADAETAASKFPSFMGQPWRNIPDDEKVDAWVWLRDWVDWLTLTYRVTKNQLTPCWYRHTDVVEILWAMANAEAKAWAEGTGTPTSMPLTGWQNYIPGCLSQIQEMVNACALEQKHQEVKQWLAGEHPFVRTLNERDWQNFISGAVRTLDGAEAGVWRAVVLDKAGNAVGQSEEFVLGEHVVPEQAGLGDMFYGYRGDSEPMAFVRVSGTDAQILQWQRKNEAGEWESSLGTEVRGSVLAEEREMQDLKDKVDPELQPAVGP